MTPILAFDGVSKWYGHVIGLNKLTLHVPPGVTGLLGPNGAGKSTLLQLATGQLRPSQGTVRVLGQSVWDNPALNRVLGLCPEQDAFYEWMTGHDFVRTCARLNGQSRREANEAAGKAMDRVGMTEHMSRPIRGYSKGMRQRTKLAQALLHDPEVLILDEPLNGVDPIGRQESVALFRQLAGRGKCLLVSSHELEELEKLTDHVAVMARGRIAAVGTLTQIRDLLDDQPRRLAAALMALDDVVGVELAEGAALVARARNPRKFFQELTTLVLEEGHDVRHVETLDDSAEAILGYLLGGRRGS